MTEAVSIQQLEALIQEVIEDQPELFLVALKIKPTNNIKVFLDADNGLSIEKCTKINRRLYKIIEEHNWYPEGNFSLEVSSPGVDEPFKLLRQYRKNVGRKVEVTFPDDMKIEGTLTKVNDSTFEVAITTGKNKKAETLTKEISFADIKQTKVVVSF